MSLLDSVEIVSVLCVSVYTTRTVLKSLVTFVSVFTQKCPLCQCSHKDSVEIVSVRLCVSVHTTRTMLKSLVSFVSVFTQKCPLCQCFHKDSVENRLCPLR